MSVISPFGLGADAFTEGVRTRGPALSLVEEDLPYAFQGEVGGFDIGEILGETKNLANLGRSASLALGTVALLLRQHDLAEFAPAERALVLGGDLIGMDRGMGIMRESLTNAQPFQVNTKAYPSSIMNFSAAQCAIRFGFKGSNSTVTTGRMTGLSVLNYARRIHRHGRSPMVLACAVEDLNPRRSWLTWHGLGTRDPLGEGCCVFLTESAESARTHGRQPVAEVLALEFGYAPRPEAVAYTLAARIGRALRRADLDEDDVWAAAVSGSSADELAAVSAVLGADARVLEPASLIGDTDGASAAFQLATAIAHGMDGDIAIVTSADPDGQVGCGVFRIFDR
ncbi:beta-ketoacyl synthase N-terminal-like domain-containing protein [Lentzea sp. NPDC051213]|uniref:beta-ketoacyl synthase N-terminal-like domain-containing protein n=1 Tax=Lentzea sp. NPDC051213 TaxID=3364126 RepID=UPI00379D9F65